VPCQGESPGVAFLGVAFHEGAYQEGAFLVGAFRMEAFQEAVVRTFDLVLKPQLAELAASWTEPDRPLLQLGPQGPLEPCQGRALAFHAPLLLLYQARRGLSGHRHREAAVLRSS